MVKKIIAIETGEPTSPGLIKGTESGARPVEVKPAGVEAGVSAIAERVEAIEAGEVPAVDKKILEGARKAISHEIGDVAESRAQLQHFLDILNGGDVTDPAGALDQILDASAGNRSKPELG